MINLNIKLRDHLKEPIPLDTPVMVLDVTGGSFGYDLDFNITQSRIFAAFVEYENGVDANTQKVDYTYPNFGKANFRVMVDLGDDTECSGHTFLHRRYLWCLASEVQPTLMQIDEYFGLEPFLGADLEEDPQELGEDDD